MKIAILGYSGSGKSTLAKKLAEVYGCDVLHLDSVHFSAGWVERPTEDMIKDVRRFMEKDNWIIEGNYKSVLHQERLEQADQIIILRFNRFSCLWRAFKRYRKYKGKTRSDMAPGCDEKFDWEFVRWILWEGRAKQKSRFNKIKQAFPNKVIVIKNQPQLDDFVKSIKKFTDY